MNDWKQCPMCACMNNSRETCVDCGSGLKDVKTVRPLMPVSEQSLGASPCSTLGTNYPKGVPHSGLAKSLLRLLTAASLMRITIKERATFLTKTTDWERLEDAMRNAERELKAEKDKSTE